MKNNSSSEIGVPGNGLLVIALVGGLILPVFGVLSGYLFLPIISVIAGVIGYFRYPDGDDKNLSLMSVFATCVFWFLSTIHVFLGT